MTEQNHFEPQYKILDEFKNNYGECSLGPMSSFTWNNDPKRLVFVLSRYKFVASMLEEEDNVLEIGCGDSFGSRIVAQSVRKLTVSDVDNEFLESARNASKDPFEYSIKKLNLCEYPSINKYSSAYLLDVLEHIPPSLEEKFLTNLKLSLNLGSKIIIGMPSLESQIYASSASKEGHINCQSKNQLKRTLKKYFSTVFMFSMNDEVIHTGFAPMSHYLMAVCVN